MVKQFSDVPLPGLEGLGGRVEHDERSERRRYDRFIEPTPGAISSPDGYGRVTWRAGGVSRTLSAHRFALAIAVGDAPDDAGVAEHRCNEPLCVRVDGAHVVRSTQTANLAYAVACGRAGAHRLDTGGVTRVQRSRAVRAAVAGGWDAVAYAAVAGETVPDPTPRLF